MDAHSPPAAEPALFHNVSIPVDWLTGGTLPPVCLLTGAPTDGRLQEMVVDVVGGSRSAIPASPGLRGLLTRRMTVRLPLAAAAHRAAWWRRRILLVVFAITPVAVLFACREFLGWRSVALAASGIALVVVGFLACLELLRRDFQVSLESEGWASLRVPNRDAAAAITAALAEKGLCAPRTCLVCKEEGSPPFEGSGHGSYWICASCTRKPAAGGGRKKRSLWLALPYAFLTIVFVLPPVFLFGAVRRMARGIPDFVAGCAVLAASAAILVPWRGVGMAAAPLAAGALTAIAWVMRAESESARATTTFAVFVSIFAVAVQMARLLAWW